MAFNKNDKADGAKVRRGGIRRRKKAVSYTHLVFCKHFFLKNAD